MMRKYSTPQIEAIFTTFGLNTIKVSGQNKKVWKMSQNWKQGYRLQDISYQVLGNHQIRMELKFRDESGLQRTKKVLADPKANVLKDLSQTQIIQILDKVKNVSIFSQSFWQIWFTSFGQLNKNIVLAILKQIIGIPFTIQVLAQFTKEYSQQALTTLKQSQAMKKVLQVFGINKIQLAINKDKKPWGISKQWNQQFVLHNINYIDTPSKQQGAARIEFTVPGSITRSKVIKFVPQTQFKQGSLQNLLGRLTKVRSRGLFSQVFWQLWLKFIQHQPNRAKNLLKAELGLPLSQAEQINLDNFKQDKKQQNSSQESFQSGEHAQSEQVSAKSLSQNLKMIRQLARKSRMKSIQKEETPNKEKQQIQKYIS